MSTHAAIVFKLTFMDENGVAVGGSSIFRVIASARNDIDMFANSAATNLWSKFTDEFAQLLTPDCNFDIIYTGWLAVHLLFPQHLFG